jgi:hypothetical protein
MPQKPEHSSRLSSRPNRIGPALGGRRNPPEQASPENGAVLEALLYRGELPRGDAVILNTGERQARRVVSALTDHGVLTSESSRAPLHLAFPATLAARWMPGLFPDRTA